MEQSIREAVVNQYWKNASSYVMAKEALRVTGKTGRPVQEYQKIIEQHLVDLNFTQMVKQLAMWLDTVEFTANSHHLTVNHDDGEYFWTTKDGYEQKGFSASATECQQAALEWASSRHQEGVRAEEEAEQVRRFGKDVDQWRTRPW